MGETSSSKLPPILSIGTGVVSLVDVRGSDGRPVRPRGTAGVIVKAPADAEHSYRVQFPGGDEASLKRMELQVLRHFQSEGLHPAVDPLVEHDLYSHVIFRCVIGSRAYGLEREASDVDRRGVYLAPARMHWSIFGVPEQLENPENEECYWELEKFLKLALKANPNVLEVLYSPLVEHATPLAQRMIDMRAKFLSRLVYQTFNGYAMSQFRKLEQDLRTKGAVKWKHAMHLLRLLLAGIEALETGEVPVLVRGNRDRLLSIRDGAMAWEEVDRWRLELHGQFERAFVETKLPERPDYEAVNEILIDARSEAARKDGLM